MNACKGCGAPILWAVTEAGRLMPLDIEPTADGTIELTDRWITTAAGEARQCRVIDEQLALFVLGPRYTSHFATCPHAKAFRR